MQICKRERITRHDGHPYLDRLIIFGCDYFKVMLHRFLSSDDDCLHDHPWDFVSIILRGSYWEWTFRTWGGLLGGLYGTGNLFDRDTSADNQWVTHYPTGSILFRRALHAHRIEIDAKRPPVSLVITGIRKRPWGFFTRTGWIHWESYKHQEHCA